MVPNSEVTVTEGLRFRSYRGLYTDSTVKGYIGIMGIERLWNLLVVVKIMVPFRVP